MKRILLVLGLLASAQQAAATETEELGGAELFERHCAACHGDLGKGDGPVASAMSVKVPDLTQIAARRDGEFPREELRSIIDGRWRIDAHGTQQMPVWGYEFWIAEGGGDFSEVRVSGMLNGLLDYLESIQR